MNTFQIPFGRLPNKEKATTFFFFLNQVIYQAEIKTLAHRLVPYKTVEGRKLSLTSILFSFPKKVEKQTMTGPKWALFKSPLPKQGKSLTSFFFPTNKKSKTYPSIFPQFLGNQAEKKGTELKIESKNQNAKTKKF